jgi:hypothetical protein
MLLMTLREFGHFWFDSMMFIFYNFSQKMVFFETPCRYFLQRKITDHPFF